MDPSQQILETQVVRAAVPAPIAPGFTVGSVLSKTLSTWWKHVLAFTGLSVVVYAPFAATLGVFYGDVLSGRAAPGPDDVAAFGLGVVGLSLVTLLLAVVQAGAVTYATVRTLSGERVRLGDMLRVGLRRVLPVIGVGLLLWLAFMVGFVLLVVPGILLMVATCVAIPAAVVEKPGVLGAIRRSLALTKGRRWTLFAAGLVVLVVLWVLTAAVQVAAMAASAALLPRQLALVGAMVGSQLGNVLFSALPLIGVAVAYHDLRVAKEGVDTAVLAKVFE